MAASSVYGTIGFPDLADREARAALVLGALTWAYLDSVAGLGPANVQPRMLRSAFQLLYNENPRAASFGFEDRAAAEAYLPTALPTDGRFGAATRNAMVGALVSGAGMTPPDADSLPADFARHGDWFISMGIPFNPPGATGASTYATAAERAFLWQVANVAETSGADASSILENDLRVYIEGGADAVSAASVPVPAPPPTPPTAVVVDPEPEGLPPLIVTAQRREFLPAWAVWSIGAGVLVLAGTLGYQAWKKSRRRR